MPVIASLNGTTPGGWIDLARDLEKAGAAALELNLYEVVTDLSETAADVESRQLSSSARSIQAVRHSSDRQIVAVLFLAARVRPTARRGRARAIVVFNRFYQPDIDLEALDVSRDIRLSTNAELPLRLHACALLSGRTSLQLGVSGGVHSGDDAAKAVLPERIPCRSSPLCLSRGRDACRDSSRNFGSVCRASGYHIGGAGSRRPVTESRSRSARLGATELRPAAERLGTPSTIKEHAMSETKEKAPWHGIPREEIPWLPTIDPETCIGCQLCYVTCGRNVYEMHEAHAVAVDPMNCAVGCYDVCQHLPHQRHRVPIARRRLEARTRAADFPHGEEGSSAEARPRRRAQGT